VLVYERRQDGEFSVTAVNRSAEPQMVSIPWNACTATDLLTGKQFTVCNGQLQLTLPPYGGFLLA
jgi:hypothetical protein